MEQQDHLTNSTKSPQHAGEFHSTLPTIREALNALPPEQPAAEERAIRELLAIPGALRTFDEVMALPCLDWGMPLEPTGAAAVSASAN